MFCNLRFLQKTKTYKLKTYKMAITSSAKKAIRNSKRKTVFNLRRKGDIVNTIKKLKKLVNEKNKKEALALLPKVYQVYDKAVKTKFLKKNSASRKKSRITALVNKIV